MRVPSSVTDLSVCGVCMLSVEEEVIQSYGSSVCVVCVLSVGEEVIQSYGSSVCVCV